MTTFNDNIFVTGGNSGLSKRVDIHETEIYSGMTDQWTLVSPLPMAHSEGGCESYEGKIYVVGGYSWAHQKCLSTIQCYDPIKDMWEGAGNLPIELSGVRLTSITIPYSVAPRSGAHVPLSWPPKQVSGRFMEQDPRILMGGMAGMPLMTGLPGIGVPPGGFPGIGSAYHPGAQPMTGFMDPLAMQEMREAMANMNMGQDQRMNPSQAPRVRSNPSSQTDLTAQALAEANQQFRSHDDIYSRPRSISIDDPLGFRSSSFGKSDLETNPSQTNTLTSSGSSGKKSGSVKSASFREPVSNLDNGKRTSSSSSSSSHETAKAEFSSLPALEKEESVVDESEIRAYRP